MKDHVAFVRAANAKQYRLHRRLMLRCKLHTWLDRVLTWAGL